MIEKDHIENLYEKSFEDFSDASDAGDWAALSGKVAKQNFMKFGLSHFNIYYTLLIVSVITIAGVFFMQNSKNVSASSENSVPETQNKVVAPAENKTNEDNIKDAAFDVSIKEKIENANEESVIEKKTNSKNNSEIIYSAPDKKQVQENKNLNQEKVKDTPVKEEIINKESPVQNSKEELPVITHPEENAKDIPADVNQIKEQTKPAPVRKTISIEQHDTIYKNDTVMVKGKLKFKKRN
ncbi:MAG: hypothetical protein A2275_10200 [Bacteroidetes bacterium RIFOXYA12_FULL_35_11]|nr:MAG: hypothetical protein A2X01_14110 [Bacteroidetes bacterium GWF2_35_48]OFY76774.1 MAG: hypothetical protein A2275_10200 [Bacteroidetes bacterium RIFOXYA12_FULL_35_11]HBX52282.1 hypothetical protein [Bacteroidales bacterium]